MQRKSKLLVTIFLLLSLCGCTRIPHIMENYDRGCKPSYSSVEKSEMDKVRINGQSYRSYLFIYDKFPDKLRDDMYCIVSNTHSARSILIGFYSPITDTAVFILENVKEDKLISMTFAANGKEKTLRIETYTTLKGSLELLAGSTRLSSPVFNLGQTRTTIPNSEFMILINVLSNGKLFPNK